MKTVYFDLSTDGDPDKTGKHELTEIGAVCRNQEFTREVVEGDEKRALTSFLAFLKSLSGVKFDRNETICLIAHNGKDFDFDQLVKILKRHELKPPACHVVLFDSLIWAREKFGRGEASLQDLMHRYELGKQNHEALDDAKNLR